MRPEIKKTVVCILFISFIIFLIMPQTWLYALMLVLGIAINYFLFRIWHDNAHKDKDL
jgi:fatty acid desaturase